MKALQHAWLGNYEVSSTVCTGLTFARHSHDECVIGVNLVGEEKVWLDRREFDAGPGSIRCTTQGRFKAAVRRMARPGSSSASTSRRINWPRTWAWRTWSLIARYVFNRCSRNAWRRR